MPFKLYLPYSPAYLILLPAIIRKAAQDRVWFMNSNNITPTLKNNITDKSLRPVLIASEYTISEYPTLLKHFLAGLVDQSIPKVCIFPPETLPEVILAPSV